MIYTNKYGTIEVCEKNKQMFRNKTIGISMSGGADSTMLCWMVAKASREDKLNITIQPYNGFDMWAPKDSSGVFYIIKYIRSQFPDVKILWPMSVVFDTEGDQEKDKNWYIRPFVRKMLARGFLDEIIPGISMGPPLEAQKTFNVKDKDKQIRRIPGYHLYHEIKNVPDERAPFKNVDKRFILECYREMGLVDLLEKTWSCTEPVETPCGICWWCQERAWTVRQVFGDTEPSLLIYEEGDRT